MEQEYLNLSPVILIGLIILTAYLVRCLRRQISLHLRRLESMVSIVTIENLKAIDVARELVSESEIEEVTVSTHPEIKFDHYDSDTATVNLTEKTALSDKLTDVFIASHEACHAILDRSSKVLKWIIDSSASFMLRALTVWLAVVCAFWMIYEWSHLYWGILAGIAVQLFATTLIQIVEMIVNCMTNRLLAAKFNLAAELKRHLRRCGRTALATHFCDVLIPLSCIVILLSGTEFVPLWVAPLPALLFFFITILASLYRRFVGNRFLTGFIRLPF